MIKILFEDESILVCIKPAGTLSEDSLSDKSLPNIIRQQSGLDSLYTVHRLDREVCGVMLFAKTPCVAKKLSEDVAQRKLKKEYLAIVNGTPTEVSGTLVDLLFKDSSKNKSYVVKRERRGVKKASLYYETISSKEGTSLIKIDLHTGRTHQIRVQFSSRGHSILGDGKYGSPRRENAIALCSHKISFVHPIQNLSLCFSFTPPADDALWGTYVNELCKIE